MKCSKGFTLMELLVTLGIMGLLSSISVANYLEYKMHAYNVKTVMTMDLAIKTARIIEMELPDAKGGGLASELASVAGPTMVAYYQHFNHSLNQNLEDLLPDKVKTDPDQYLWLYVGTDCGGTCPNWSGVTTIWSYNCKGNVMLYRQEFYGKSYDGDINSVVFDKASNPGYWSSCP